MILTLLLYTLHDGTLCHTFANTAFSIIHWFIIMIHSSNNGLDNRQILLDFRLEKYGFTSSKTFFNPLCVLAEHSTYFIAPSSRDNPSPWLCEMAFSLLLAKKSMKSDFESLMIS